MSRNEHNNMWKGCVNLFLIYACFLFLLSLSSPFPCLTTTQFFPGLTKATPDNVAGVS
jgi:hypothetical protein